ncbi:MAG: hypothetical protein A4E35_02134 [Methanoregula sp. PtaU1.Bin051]|nr:MAG: hypothetical protein A4E35_02134 [Methanoregula sp. PtaU1.Bin051]
MLKFIKGLFKPEEEPPLLIRFDEIPSWLKNRRSEAIERLTSCIAKEQAGIRSSAGRLKGVVEILHAAQFNETIHPRLKSIAEKSLPQYFRVVMAALEKPLPDEPEEFYAAAAELLKACINSAQAQGRYLMAAFPDEMKAVTACVAEIGRSVNEMNGPIGSYRDEITRIDAAEKIHAALVDINEDLTKSKEKEIRMVRRREETDTRIAACEQVSAELEQRRAGPDLAGLEAALLQLKKERDSTLRKYSAMSMTASHVLRKAEKVARRQHRSSDERAIAAAMHLLSDHTVPDQAGLAGVLDAAYTPVRRMIDAGEIALKNKEERALFSTKDEFSCGIEARSAQYARQAAQYIAAEQAFSSHPVITKHKDVTNEMHQLFEARAKEKQAYADLIKWQDDLRKKIPDLREKLEKILGGISGGDVQISFPDTVPVSP